MFNSAPKPREKDMSSESSVAATSSMRVLIERLEFVHSQRWTTCGQFSRVVGMGIA